MLPHFVLHWIAEYAYAGVFSLLMLGIVGLPIPDETLLTFSGYLIYKGQLHFVPTLVAAFLGSICGITLSYGLGRIVGVAMINKFGSFIHLTPENLARVHYWFDRFGKWTLMIGYFIPGVRHVTAIVAGASKRGWLVFALFAYAGGFLWSVIFIALGFWGGEEWAAMPAEVQRYLLIGSAVMLVIVFLYVLVQHRRGKKNFRFDVTN
ncbi:MAG: DedA family protein [candidate division KSB1 bacterium]|nr:DedA family protein [candidate division KSB1 bacterium]MDZ7311309.1 DedA family protein [candidate division KSB1 bacterium]